MRSSLLLSAALLSCLALAGCDGNPLLDPGPVQRDVAAEDAALANAAAAAITPPGSLPTSGSASYNGTVAASVSGDYVGSLYADLAMNVDFGSGTVSGEVSHADLVDDATGAVVQNLDGTLTISGGQGGGVVTATATGVLAATSSGPVTGAGTASLGLLGTVRTDTTTADTVYGTAAGSVSGDLNLGLSGGAFYGSTH